MHKHDSYRAGCWSLAIEPITPPRPAHSAEPVMSGPFLSRSFFVKPPDIGSLSLQKTAIFVAAPNQHQMQWHPQCYCLVCKKKNFNLTERPSVAPCLNYAPIGVGA